MSLAFRHLWVLLSVVPLAAAAAVAAVVVVPCVL